MVFRAAEKLGQKSRKNPIEKSMDIIEGKYEVVIVEQTWGLALSGGGIRAAVHIGVLQVLEDHGLMPDCIAGTSGGAIVAGLYAAGLTGYQLEEVFLEQIPAKRRLLGSKHKGAGFLRGVALEQRLEKYLPGPKTLAQLGALQANSRQRRGLIIHAVDLHDGRETLFCDTHTAAGLRRCSQGLHRHYRISSNCTIARAIRASCSIPGIFLPPTIGGQRYVDGGVRQGYPLEALLEVGGVTAALGVQLGYSGQRRDNGKTWGMADVLGQSLDIMMLHQYRLTKRQERWPGRKGVTLLPHIYDVGLFDLAQIPALVAAGRDLIARYLQSRGITAHQSIPTKHRLLLPSVPGMVEFPSGW